MFKEASELPFTLPWSDVEVAYLREWQEVSGFHPLTCNGGLHWEKHVHDHEVVLTPTPEGLKCPECGRIQTWLP